MFQALFNSLSGLFSFSKSLNTVSNNVSNMNTPGFRGGDSFFANINGGRGVRIAGDGMRTKPGDIRQTSTPTDLAVDGEGYFVLRDEDGDLHYTRAGQFRFNEEGLLVDSVNGFEVMGLDESGNLISIDFDLYRTIPPVATTGVHFKGNLQAGSTTTSVNFTVFDATGAEHTLTASFANNTSVIPGSFLVTVKEGDVTVGTGEVRFQTDGSPQAAPYNAMTITLTNGGVGQSIALNFGTPGVWDGMFSSAQSTPLSADVDDGHGLLGVADLKFDEKGILQLVYSQSEKRSGPQVALAAFPNESALQMSGGRLISGVTIDQREIGRAGEGRFGSIAGGSLEMANVDLTQEFADMIIIQRGYQASSRVMTVSNEMLEQLYNSTRGG